MTSDPTPQRPALTAQPTPGPWMAEQHAWKSGRNITDQQGLILAKVGPSHRTAYSADNANADLIAAAPDLLAALESIAQGGDETSRSVARAAIAKARGRSA